MRSLTLLVTSLCCIPGDLSLLMRSVDIPAYQLLGDDVTLRCNYDLDGLGLYSVKWYKDDSEFYRYMPSSRQPKHVFNDVPGVTVDVLESDERRVVLKSLTVPSGGQFRCEVSSEAPVFATVSGNDSLLVVAPPESEPVITGLEDGVWTPGGTLLLNCTAGRSHPAAELQWTVNDRLIQGDLLMPWPTEEHQDGLETASLGLSLHLHPTLFSSGAAGVRLRVSCTATVRAHIVEEGRSSLSATDLVYQRSVSHSIGGGGSAVHPSGILTAVLLLASSATAALGPLSGA